MFEVSACRINLVLHHTNILDSKRYEDFIGFIGFTTFVLGAAVNVFILL